MGAPAALPVPDKNARTLAMLAHLLAIFTCFLGPLVLYLVKKDEDSFIAFHSLQAVYWELAIWVGIVAASVVTIFLCGAGGLAVYVIGLVYNIMLLIKANDGQWAEYPVVGRWALK